MEIKHVSQLKGYMRQETKALKINSISGYTYYFCRQFLERLYKTTPDYFVLAGSFAQFAYTGVTRPLTDIDACSKTVEEGLDLIRLAIDDSKRDPISFSLKEIFITTNDTACLRILCNFEHMQHAIGLDIKAEPYYSLNRRQLPVLFSQDKPVEVNVISLEEHMARKLMSVCIRLQLYKNGKKFKRFKDFYDIDDMVKHSNLDMDEVIRYAALFNEKEQINIEPEILDEDFMVKNQSIWEAEAKEYQFKDPNFVATVTCVKNLLEQIAINQKKTR